MPKSSCPAFFIWQRLEQAHAREPRHAELAFYCQQVLPHLMRQFQDAAKATLLLVAALEEGLAAGLTQEQLEKLHPADLSPFLTILSE